MPLTKANAPARYAIRKGAGKMKLRFMVDTIEEGICSLVSIDDPMLSVKWPQSSLPPKVGPGSVVGFELRKDRTAARQAELLVKAKLDELLTGGKK